MAAKTKNIPVEAQPKANAQLKANAAPEIRGFSFGYGSGRGAERRQEIRYCCDDAAEAHLLNGDETSFEVTVLEISRSGLRLELPKRVPQGSRMEVILPGQVRIVGEVRYCSPAESSFHGGILIQEVTFPPPTPADHLDDESLQLYLAGEGLTLPQVLGVEDHLTRCPECGLRFRARVTNRSAASNR